MTHLCAALADEIAAGGIRHAFGVVGGGNILAVAGLTARGVHYLSARHEGGAVAMADAYYRVTGEVAVATTSHGAGLANAATTLAEAVRHGSSLILVCGDAPRSGLRAADIDQLPFAESLGARALRITDVREARAVTALAVRMARSGAGPVVLCVPFDLRAAEVPDEPCGAIELPAQTVRSEPDLDQVLPLLARARRPLILAGLGAWRANAGKILLDLADRTGALLATTVMANGLFAGSPWSAGICGGFSSPQGAGLIANADLVLTFGASLDTFTTHGGRRFAPDVTMVRFDVGEPPSSDLVGIEVRADATAAATALLDALDAAGVPASGWRREVGEWPAGRGWAELPFTDQSTAERIDPRTLTVALGALLPDEKTVVLDGGHNETWPAMYWPAPDPSAMLFVGLAFQAIGLGFASAVGAAIGRSDRLTVSILGDGGALMGLSELDSVVRSGVPQLVVVYDDGAYGFEVHMYRDVADHATTTFGDTDFAGIARALGAEAVTVRQVRDLDAVRAWLDRGHPGVLLLDCKIRPDVIAPFLAELAAGH